MKKICSLLLLVVFLIQSTGIVLAENELVLSDTTNISSTSENCYAKVTKDEFHGDSGYSLHLYTTGDYLEIGQSFTEALSAGTYTLTWYGKGSGKLWYYQNWGNEWTASFLDGIAEAMPDGWTKYQKEIVVDGNGDTSFLFHTDGAVDFYIDDISLVDGNGTDYIRDGGFNEVTGDSQGGGDEPDVPDEPDIPDDKLILSNTTTIEGTQNENRYARATDNEKNSGKYSLHIYSTAAGFEFGQRYKVANLPQGAYTLTWYTKGSDGAMSFWSNWGEYVYNTSLTPELQANGWKKYTSELQIDGVGDTRFLFYADTAIDCYIDDISLTDSNGTNYIIDGGFEEVTVVGGEVEAPDYKKYETLILSCSDFQNTAGSTAGAQTVTSIINSIKSNGLMSADAFFCCGDYANTYNETEANLNILKSAVIGFVPDAERHIYVQGNHDAQIGTQGLAQSGNNDPANGEYGVFVINEDDYMWYNVDEERIKNTAKELADYLNEKLKSGYENPIFVLSHLPLNKSWRTTVDGDAKYANHLFHVLNQAGAQGLNIVFMYGHDHSSGYDSYLGGSAVYLAKGDSINIPQGSVTAFKKETLNFTYMNAGYVGYYAAASGRDSSLNMCVFGIDEDTDTVDVFRYDENGLHNLKSAGILKSEEVTAGEYEADTKVYTSPQSISLSEVHYEGDIEALPESGGDANMDDSKLQLSGTTKIEGTQNENRYARATDDEQNSGKYSLKIYSATAGFEFGQKYTVANLPQGTYTVTWYAKGSDGNMAFWSNWGENARNVSLTPTVQANGWKKYTSELQIDGVGDTRFLFYADTPLDCYIDDISLTDSNGTNYIIDGGFEEVTVIGEETPDIPEDDEEEIYKPDLILSGTTIVSGSNGETCYGEASGDYFRGAEGYSLHLVSSGDVNFTVSQKTVEACQAGESYVLTVYAKPVKGRVWFRVGWGDDAWMVAAEDGEEQPDGWKKYEKTIIIGPESSNDFFFYSDQETEFYIDDITLVKAETTENLIPDGDFSEVTVIEPVLPDYTITNPALFLAGQKVQAIGASGEYTLSVKVRNNGISQGLPVELLVAMFNPSGEMEGLYSAKEIVEKTELSQPRTNLMVSFHAENGYTAEAYIINNRQDIDVYKAPVGF